MNEQLVLTDKIMSALARYRIEPSHSDVASFAKQLIACQIKEAILRSFLQSRGHEKSAQTMDIYNFLKDTKESGQADEALWCAFLAAHFGRPSANPYHVGEIESAGRFLCAFGDKPTWTWAYVSTNRDTFIKELGVREKDLMTLRFGNHRKYCSKKPQELARVVTDFVQWVDEYAGNPSTAFTFPPGSTPQQGFGELYRRFTVFSFGRTGRFDLLTLLSQTGLLNIQPNSCYLLGSTGPLNGAKQLCGNRFSNQELSEIIDSLAGSLEVPYDVIEDALCIWQKEPGKQIADQQPDFPTSPFIPVQTIHRK
jgi:hypothetical protein